MNTWKEAIIDQLVCCHIYNKTHDDNPYKAIMDLIAWHIDVALDPDVSEDAQALIYIGASVENEACIELCNEVDKDSQSQWPKRLATMIKARMPDEY